MSMVSSNSSLMMLMRVDLEILPSLLGWPPRATKASTKGLRYCNLIEDINEAAKGQEAVQQTGGGGGGQCRWELEQ